MSLRIDVADGTLDLLPNAEEDFYVTKQVHDLHDLETREGDFTRTIIVPYSNNNLALLGVDMPTFTRHGTQGTRFIPCQLFLQGVSIFHEPVLRIEFGDEEGFTLTIFSGSVGFFLRLSSDPISALDLSDLNFDWTLANVEARKNNTNGLVCAHNCWIDNPSLKLSLLEGGNPTQDRLNGMSLPNMGFFIYFREIIDRIMTSASMEGLKLDYGDLQSDATFNTMAFANRMNQLRSPYKGANLGYGGLYSAPQLLGITGGANFKSLIVGSGLVNISIVNNEFVIPESGAVNITTQTGGFTLLLGFSLTVSIMRNDEIVTSETRVGSGALQSIYIQINTSLGANDRLWFRVVTSGQSNQTAAAAFNLSGVIRRDSGQTPDPLVRVQDFLPEISQLNFVKSVLAMFNMVVTEKENTVTFSAWDKIPAAAPIEIDLDSSRRVSESGIFAGYGRRNELKYSANDAIERSDENTEFAVNVAGIEDVVTKIELPFFACDESETVGGVRASIPSYSIATVVEDGNQISFVLSTGNYTTADKTALKVGDVLTLDGGAFYRRVTAVTSKTTGTVDVIFSVAPLAFTNWRYNRYTENTAPAPQIALMQAVTGSNFVLTDGGSSSTTAGDFKRALFAPQLSFSFLMDNYFKNLVASLVSPFTLQAWFHIDILQFIDIDQLRPFYLASYGANFYVNLIEQYKTRGLVRIELLQVGASTTPVADSQGLQVGAFSNAFSNDFDNYDQNEI